MKIYLTSFNPRINITALASVLFAVETSTAQAAQPTANSDLVAIIYTADGHGNSICAIAPRCRSRSECRQDLEVLHE